MISLIFSKVKPTWVNETLSDDSDGEMVNGDEQTIKSEPVEERKHKEGEETDPLPPDTEDAAAAEAGADDPTAAEANGENGFVPLMPVESGMMATASVPDDSAEASSMQGVGEENPLGDTMEDGLTPAGEQQLLQAEQPAQDTAGAMEVDTTKGLVDPEESFMSREAPPASYASELGTTGEVDSSSGAYESAHQAKGLADHPMTEEDLLTGPAHNLDDSQYKSDIVDPNLDDIFK